MSRTKISLEEQILQAFKRAYLEERLDVADHLLRALEVLQSNSLFGIPAGAPKPNKVTISQPLMPRSSERRQIRQVDGSKYLPEQRPGCRTADRRAIWALAHFWCSHAETRHAAVSRSIRPR